ncbi:glycosyltransferase family 4 protein [Roseivirga echinicomitans]
MGKKICMLLHEFYPNDIRVTKEVTSLTAAGFEIHLICLQRKNELSTEEVNGIKVHRIPMAQTFFWRGIWDVLLVAFGFFQPKFHKKLFVLNQKENFDALHVHDLPLAKTALQLKQKNPALKVVLDFHENYPEALKVWFAWKTNPFIRLKNNIFFGFEKWLQYEKEMSQSADKVIVVVEEMAERIHQLHNIPLSKIITITNSEGKDFLNQERFEDIYTLEEGDFILAYTGGVGPHRGVDVAIEGLQYLKQYPQIKLELTGTLSTATRNWLTTLIEKFGVEKQVRINGYQPFTKFFSYMAFAHVNLIPHNRNGHTDNTIPHKLYQGMMVGKPVLVSDAPPLKRVVEALNSGLVFEGGNPKDFADKVEALYLNKELYMQLGKNGYDATINQDSNWEATGEILVEEYQKLLDTNDRQKKEDY